MIFFFKIQTALPAGELEQEERSMLDQISELTTRLLDLKKTQSWLNDQRAKSLKTKCLRMKKLQLDEYKAKNIELDDREKELCRKTNQLMADLTSTCDNTPFQKSLIKILQNLKAAMNTTRNHSKTCGNNISLLIDTVHSLESAQEIHFRKLDKVIEKVKFLIIIIIIIVLGRHFPSFIERIIE